MFSWWQTQSIFLLGLVLANLSVGYADEYYSQRPDVRSLIGELAQAESPKPRVPKLRMPPDVVPNVLFLEQQATKLLNHHDNNAVALRPSLSKRIVPAWGGILEDDLEYLLPALTLAVAQIYTFYEDHEIYFLGPDAEVLYDLARVLANDSLYENFEKRLHLIAAAPQLMVDPHYEQYLAQEGMDLAALKAGKKFLLVETGRYSLGKNLMTLLFEGFRRDVLYDDHQKGIFSGRYRYQFRHFTFGDRFETPLAKAESASALFHSGGRTSPRTSPFLKAFERIPSYSQAPVRVEYVNHRWEVVCVKPSVLYFVMWRSDRALATELMRDIAHRGEDLSGWYFDIAGVLSRVRYELQYGRFGEATRVLAEIWSYYTEPNLANAVMLDSVRMLIQRVKTNTEAQFFESYGKTLSGRRSVEGKMWDNWAEEMLNHPADIDPKVLRAVVEEALGATRLRFAGLPMIEQSSHGHVTGHIGSGAQTSEKPIDSKK